MPSSLADLFKHLKYDLPAGLVVYLVALPLCLGVALASTDDPSLMFSGIIAGFVGGIVVAALSGSALGVSGPAAGLVVIVLTALDKLGSFEAFLLAVVMAGIIQFIAGFLKAGIIGYYFPSSVIKGMLAAIGLILIMKEIPHALGYDEDYMGDFDFSQKDGHNTITEIYYAFKYSSLGAIIISVVSMALLLLFDRPFMQRFQLFRFLPGALIVVVVGSLLNLGFASFVPDLYMTGKHLVQLPVAGSPSDFISFFRMPDFSAVSNPDVYVVALTIAVVASLETLLSVEATDKLDPQKRKTDTNRELKAQGVGNILAGLIGGLPITQVIVRSSANINSGGRTKMSAIFHGFLLLSSAILIPSLLNYIPLAALACILLMVGYKLSKAGLFIGMYRLGWEQFLPFVVTVAAILFTDLLKGIGIGMVVAIYFILMRNYRHSYHRHVETGANGEETIVLTLSEEVTFLNKGSIQLTLDHLPDSSTVFIDGSKCMNIDFDVLEVIQNFREHTAPPRGIKVLAKGLSAIQSVGGH